MGIVKDPGDGKRDEIPEPNAVYFNEEAPELDDSSSDDSLTPSDLVELEPFAVILDVAVPELGGPPPPPELEEYIEISDVALHEADSGEVYPLHSCGSFDVVSPSSSTSVFSPPIASVTGIQWGVSYAFDLDAADFPHFDLLENPEPANLVVPPSPRVSETSEQPSSQPQINVDSGGGGDGFDIVPAQSTVSTSPRSRSTCSSCKQLRTMCGKRTVKRVENDKFLDTLRVILGDDPTRQPPDVFNPRPTRFSVLFENEQVNQCWTEFMQASEEEQLQFLEKSGSRSAKRRQKRRQRQNTLRQRLEEREMEESDRSELFRQLTEKQRTVITQKNLALIRLPLGVVEHIEEDLLCFFENSELDTYTSPPMTSFERRVLHIISAFHGFNSLSYDNADTKQRLTMVTRPTFFEMPEMTLYKYIGSLHTDKRKK